MEAAIAGGADVVQLRDKRATDSELAKEAEALLGVTRACGIPLIINDRIAVAKRVGADGVHLGQADGSIEKARKILGPGAIIGRSTHSRAQALQAQKEGFDYIGVGPVFSTPTKPSYPPVGLDLIRFASQNIGIPFVAIGGIDASNVEAVRRAGARAVAVVRAVMGAENPCVAAKKLVETLRATSLPPSGF